MLTFRRSSCQNMSSFWNVEVFFIFFLFSLLIMLQVKYHDYRHCYELCLFIKLNVTERKSTVTHIKSNV